MKFGPGREHKNAKLTEMQVRIIRAHPEIPCAVFGRMYGVNAETVRRARTGETWTFMDAFLPIDEVKLVENVKMEKEAEESAQRLLEKLGGKEELTDAQKEILKRYSGDR